MKKFLIAVLMAAMIAMLACTAVHAEDIVSTTDAETVIGVEIENDTVTDDVYNEQTQADVEEPHVDGAIVQNDYIARMLEGARDWAYENPETIGSTALSLIVAIISIGAAVFARKSRKSWKKEKEEYKKGIVTMNNNAVEVLNSATGVVNESRLSIAGAVRELLTGFKGLADSIIKELRATRLEVRANSVLLLEMLKDARLPVKRKEEIRDIYAAERGEETESDEENNEDKADL